MRYKLPILNIAAATAGHIYFRKFVSKMKVVMVRNADYFISNEKANSLDCNSNDGFCPGDFSFSLVPLAVIMILTSDSPALQNQIATTQNIFNCSRRGITHSNPVPLRCDLYLHRKL